MPPGLHAGGLGGDLLVIDQFGVVPVEVPDESGFNESRPFENFLHGDIGTVSGGEKLVTRAKILHGPDHGDRHTVPPHLGVDHHQVDEIMAVKIPGPNQETRRDPADKSDEDAFFSESRV